MRTTLESKNTTTKNLYIVRRRLFTAAKHPPGSPERAVLNADSLTSEYLPSRKYALRTMSGAHTPFTYHTHREARADADAMNASAGQS